MSLDKFNFDDPIPAGFDSQLTVIVPAKNEAASIVEILTHIRINFPLAEIVNVLNDCSDDSKTKVEAIKQELNIVVVEEPVKGKGNAMRAGAVAASRQFIMFHDADREYSVKDAMGVAHGTITGKLPAMGVGVRAWQLNRVPTVSFGVNLLVRMILNWRFKQSADDVLTGTRCLSKESFQAMKTTSPGFAIETEITRKAIEAGLNLHSYPVRFVNRSYKEGKKISIRHLPGIIKQALASNTPSSRQPVHNIHGQTN